MAGPADRQKDAILSELSAARKRLSATGETLRKSLDVATRTRESFQRHRPAWIGGAALVGLVLSKLPARSKTVFVEKATGQALGSAGKLGAAWTVARLAVDLAKPLLGDLAGKSVAEIAKRFVRSPEKPPPEKTERRA